MADGRAEGSIFKALRQVKREQFSVGEAVEEAADHVRDLEMEIRNLRGYIQSDERHGDKMAKRLVAGLTAAFFLTGALLTYEIWQNNRIRQIMNAVMDGNAVVGVRGEWYAVHAKDPMSNAPCKEFEVSKVILSWLNNRPSDIDPEPTATFRIPDGCKTGPGTPPRPDAHIVTRPRKPATG